MLEVLSWTSDIEKKIMGYLTCYAKLFYRPYDTVILTK